MAYHAFVRRKKGIPSRPHIGATSFDAGTSSFIVHVSPTW